MTYSYDVMVAGHVCLDIIPQFLPRPAKSIQDILVPGKLLLSGPCKISSGGPVSNTGIGLKTLGLKVCFCARIGADDLGKMTRKILEQRGNIEGLNMAGAEPSSYTIALAPPGIDRIFLHHPGSNDQFSVDDIPIPLLEQCRHFHFGYPPIMQCMFADAGDELHIIFKQAKEAGVVTSCDMALPDPDSPAGKAPWREILEKVLPFVDLFLPSLEETLFMLDPDRFAELKKKHGGDDLIFHMQLDDYTRLADTLLNMGAKMVGLKAGERGFYFKTGTQAIPESIHPLPFRVKSSWCNRELFCPAFVAPQVASATGSGDASIAGFLAAFYRGYPPEKCLKYACLVGWQNVQHLDAISGFQSWEATHQLLEQNLPFHTLSWASSDWAWIEPVLLWTGPRDRLHGQD